MIKAVLLDVDGVLYDSMPLHARAWQGAFKKAGIRLPSKLVYQIEGTKDIKSVERMLAMLRKKLSRAAMEDIRAEKVRMFNTYGKPRLISGAKAFITKAKKSRLLICLVTGSSQIKTAKRLKRDFGIKKDFVITGADVKHGKPHPEPYRMALQRVGVKAREAVVIENAPLGIQSAKSAGIRCVALKTGPLSKAELKKSGADIVLDGFKQAREIEKFMGMPA